MNDLTKTIKDIATTQVEPDPFTAMVERLATNQDVDANKLEKLVDVQMRVMEKQAEADFYAAFAQMQKDIPVIQKDGQIRVRDEVRSSYATNESIQTTLRPILTQYGFMLSFRNEYPDSSHIKVIGTLAHVGGHKIESEFLAPADTSGSKNQIQALGSSQAYGQRYVTKSLLNIVERGVDDDGQGTPTPTLTEEEQADLYAKASELFDEDRAGRLLHNMARQYFQIPGGDWHKIPSYRFGDAVKKLEEKAEQ